MIGRRLGQRDVQVDRPDLFRVRDDDVLEHGSFSGELRRRPRRIARRPAGRAGRRSTRAGMPNRRPRTSRGAGTTGSGTPRKRAVEQRRVFDRQAQRPDVIQRLAERNDARRSGSRRSSASGRPGRTPPMECEPSRRCRCRSRRTPCRARTDAADPPDEPPGERVSSSGCSDRTVRRVLVGRAERELVEVRLADEDRSRRPAGGRPPSRRVARRVRRALAMRPSSACREGR